MKMTQFAKFANNATEQILGTSGLVRENLQSMFSYPGAINLLEPVTVSGDIITINDAAPMNAKHVIVYIEPLQAGSGNPSPDNVRSINGWTNVDININNNTVNIELPIDGESVYGGTLDVTNGTLTIDRRNIVISDSVSIARNNAQQYYVYASALPEIKQPSERNNSIISDKFARAGTSFAQTGVCFLNTNGTIRFNTLSTYESASAMINDIGPIQFIYPLASPQIYQLSPTDILLSDGANTIYANCGSMELEYYRREGGSPYV